MSPFNPRRSQSVRFSGEQDVVSSASRNYDDDDVDDLAHYGYGSAVPTMNSTFSTTASRAAQPRQAWERGDELSATDDGGDRDRGRAGGAEVHPRSFSAMEFRSSVGVDDLPTTASGDWWSTVPNHQERSGHSRRTPSPDASLSSPHALARGNVRPRPHSVAGIRSASGRADHGLGYSHGSSRTFRGDEDDEAESPGGETKYWFRRPPHTELKQSLTNHLLHEEDIVDRFNYRKYYERDSSPYTDALIRLRAEENALLDRKNLLMNVEWLSENRGPAPRWYEWRTASFNKELKRNTQLERKKHAWAAMWDQTKQLQHKMVPSAAQ